MSGLNFRAMCQGIWVSSFSTVSTASVQRDRRTSPVLRSMVARMSFSWPYLARPAFWIACSMASRTSSRSIDLLARDGVGDQQQFGPGDRGVHAVFLPQFVLGGLAVAAISASVSTSLRAAHIGERQRDLAAVVELHPAWRRRRRRARCRRSASGRPAARPSRHGRVAGETVPVLHPRQRAVDAGRADLQRPGGRASDPRRRSRRRARG